MVALSNLRAEEDYLDVLGLEFLAGRNFDQALTTDKYKVILNEEAVKVLGWGGDNPTSALGQFVALASGSEDKFEVIGVVKDFNINSVREEKSHPESLSTLTMIRCGIMALVCLFIPYV